MLADFALPPAFDCAAYRAANPDLADLSDDELVAHYRDFGEAEGRIANRLSSREDFVALVPPDAAVLEIGPYYSPLLRGPNVAYFDVLSRDEMLRRAELEGFDGGAAPEIDFVSATGDLGVVDATFDAVLSSHALEHQPDLIAHFQHVERLLRPGGRYFAIVPDKRYCYDHFSAESSIAEIVAAFVERRTAHTLASVLGQSVMTTHNDCARHWNGDHGTFMESCEPRIREGVEEFEAAAGGYVDVHAWYFTPQSARTIVRVLREARFTELSLERLYPTRRNTFEFWMILRKPLAC